MQIFFSSDCILCEKKEMDFSSFEYKRKSDFQSHSYNQKKIKIYDEILNIQHLLSISNILVFNSDSVHDIKFIIADPSGNILTDRKTCDNATFLTLIQNAHKNGCVIVTYDLKNAHSRNFNFACGEFLNDAIFCILEESFIRTGVTKIDNKLKLSTCDDIYQLLHGVKPENKITQCEIILQCFVAGRMKGWF